MKNKSIFQINNKTDLKRVSFAMQKRVFSVTVVPRVLVNRYFNFMISSTHNNIFLCCVNLEIKKFQHYVHAKNYDLGLYFFEQNGKIFVQIVDGTGQFASRHTTNIFADAFFRCGKELSTFCSEISKKYRNLSKKSLLFDEKP
jgi:hypothetical protein